MGCLKRPVIKRNGGRLNGILSGEDLKTIAKELGIESKFIDDHVYQVINGKAYDITNDGFIR